MDRAKVNLEFPRAAILWRLHWALAKEEDKRFTAKTLSTELRMSAQVTALCIEELEDEGYCRSRVENSWDGREVTFIEITRIGVREVDAWEGDDYDGLVARLSQKLSPADFQKLATADATENNDQEIPASDRVVSLDHNSIEYRDAVESIDKVIEKFKEDHSLDNEIGQEKVALLQAVQAGRKLLDDTKMKMETAIALIVEPLKLVAKRYETQIVGALAAGAVTAVLALLGIV